MTDPTEIDEAAREASYMEAERRTKALSLAIRCWTPGEDDELVTARAEAFHAFLAGDQTKGSA